MAHLFNKIKMALAQVWFPPCLPGATHTITYTRPLKSETADDLRMTMRFIMYVAAYGSFPSPTQAETG